MKHCPSCYSIDINLYMGGQFGKYQCVKCGYVGPLILEIDIDQETKVLIIGGGFAGLQTALLLKKIMKNKVTITLVDEKCQHVFVPGITKFLIGKLKKDDMTVYLPQLLKNKGIHFLHSKINKINPKKKIIFLDKKEIPYDYLVVSVGSQTNSYQIKGVHEFAYTFKSLKDAECLKKEIKKVGANDQFTITVVGGGITGVEFASQLKDYFDNKFRRHKTAIQIVHAGNRLVSEMPSAVSKKVKKYFDKKKIKVISNSKVIKIKRKEIYLQPDKKINTDLIIWVAGIRAPSEIAKFKLPYSDKGIYVNKYFQSSAYPSVFALGDCATSKNKNIEKYSTKRAQTALIQGKLVAKNIAHTILGKKMISYRPRPIPTIISLNSNSIFHYKNFIIQNRFVSILKSLIRLHHCFFNFIPKKIYFSKNENKKN